MFKVAGKAEIIRSQQKDEYYLTYLRKMSADVVHSLLGARAWITWRRELDLAADLGYFCLTTLSGFQTIGEEYVNIIQVDSSRRHVPSILRRLTMVLFHVLIPYTVRKGLDWLERRLQSHGLQEVPIATREFLLKCIPIARDLVLYTHRLHMAVFYMQGMFYQLAKRFNGVQYLQYTGGAQRVSDDSVSKSFRILGWLTLAQLAGSALLGTRAYLQQTYRKGAGLIGGSDTHSEVGGQVSLDRKCALCLGERSRSSATPCGHLFCWSCIHDWCATKAECPLCREHVEPHRIVCLQNFDAS
ncbi:peroxisome biogenesis factor 10-like isoform X6 [Dreissena polymorpha]|uniref:peroxisome biogenesis factor 10-like isoform X6 n=1 Tax=Dreissena polymorpha TaxID=45954 RepID=UPI002263BCBD|nr:peroxisome biogenesis factor 10-like isoform X6 [Dreissena polymorpha]